MSDAPSFRFTDEEWARVRGSLDRAWDRLRAQGQAIERQYAQAQESVAQWLIRNNNAADRMEVCETDSHNGAWLRWARFYRGESLVGVAAMTMDPATGQTNFYTVPCAGTLPDGFEPWALYPTAPAASAP